MEKTDHIITLAAGTKNRMDQLIYAYKSRLEVDILNKLLDLGGINGETYVKELKHLYSTFTDGRVL